MTDRPLEYIDVPAGTRAAQCSAPSCKATIYWIERLSRSKKTPEKMVKIPVDCEHDAQCAEPSNGTAGIGVNHWQTCADPDRFSK